MSVHRIERPSLGSAPSPRPPGPAPMRLRALLILLAICLAPTSALAATFPIADPAGGVRLDVYTWTGRPCVVSPQQADHAACRPSDPTTAPAPSGPADVLSFAVIHFDGWDMDVLATRVAANTATFDGIEPDDMLALSKQAVRIALPATAKLVADGFDEHTEAKPSNGVPIVRVSPVIETTGASSAKTRAAAIEYVIYAARGVYEFTFVSDAAHAADVAKIADNAIASLVAAPPVRASRNVFYALGYWTGRLLLYGLVAAIVLSIGAWWNTRRRQQVRTP